jgi:hypothetical protein
MPTARSAESTSATALASALRDAPFVRVFAAADGDALAASGVLARACRDLGVPFQVRVRGRDAATIDDGVTLAVGASAPGDAADDLTVLREETPASLRAYEAASELAADPDPVLALAGVAAAGHVPGAGESDVLLTRASESGDLVRRPGVAVPTDDLADGLAHTTLAHAPFSGDVDDARAALSALSLDSSLEDRDHRAVASLLAIAVAGAPMATPRGARTVERAVRPYATPNAPFATLGGYADVLDVVARERPGTAVALALGHDAADPALDAWRAHAANAHGALREATTARYDGVFVARLPSRTAPGRLVTAARLCRDFRSPEPVALVVGDGAAAVASTGPAPLAAALDAGVEAAGPDAPGSDATDGEVRADDGATVADDRYGHARFDGDPSAFVDGFREAV